MNSKKSGKSYSSDSHTHFIRRQAIWRLRDSEQAGHIALKYSYNSCMHDVDFDALLSHLHYKKKSHTWVR